MKRRSLLKTAAAILPAAGLRDFALAHAVAAAPAVEVHAVSSGEDRFGETHSLGFSNIRFKVATGETGGNVFIVEHDHLVKGGPPLHLHFNQEEWFYVLEGEIFFQVGEERKRLGPGDSVLAPRNVPHAFCSVGEKPARMLIAFTPAGKMEQFFRDTAHPNPPAMDAVLFSKYDMKYMGPSPFES